MLPEGVRSRCKGKERDAETGNDDFGARYYSNRFGRWLSADWSNVPVAVPYANLSNPQTLNLYSMVADDPESFADLDGHDGIWDSVKGIAGGINDAVNHAYDGIVATLKDPLAPVSAAVQFADNGLKAYEEKGVSGVLSDLATQGREGATEIVTEAVLTGGLAAAANTSEAAGKTYQTYTKENAGTGEVYSGRTSGTQTPEQNVAARDTNHHMNEKDFGPAKLDKSSKNPNAIRGREQQLIEKHGGAKSQGGTSGNAINGVSPRNQKAGIYRKAAQKEFGNP